MFKLTLTSLLVLGSIIYIDKHDEIHKVNVLPSIVFALPQNDDPISIGWVGDMVPSEDADYNANIFSNVSASISTPDLMIGNLEGTFATERTSKCEKLKSMCHAFRGEPSFANSLKNAGFDFVSLVNNHSYDFGKEGLADTQAVLDTLDIPYITTEKPTFSINIKGKNIGILGLSSTKPTQTITDFDFIKSKVLELKNENDFVIVIFHGGAEGADMSDVPGINEYVGSEDRGNVMLVAQTAIDSGADLVLGAGPHVLRKIDSYKGVPIAYSLGNFVGGNKLNTMGNLRLSGIFTATLQKDKNTTYDFASVLLSAEGIPSLDYTNESKFFIDELLTNSFKKESNNHSLPAPNLFE